MFAEPRGFAERNDCSLNELSAGCEVSKVGGKVGSRTFFEAVSGVDRWIFIAFGNNGVRAFLLTLASSLVPSESAKGGSKAKSPHTNECSSVSDAHL